ncbi:MAG: RNase adapter RapZ [Gammaproteobacteria bacterium]|nr:MAG: RNase adapter RapZ [Gammaproteobacteria bacterium]
MELLIITGLSGSGKTVALHALEDNRCYCTDNLPLELIPALADQFKHSRYHESYNAVAVGIDSRTLSDDPQQIEDLFDKLEQSDITFRIIFLQASPHTLLQRFSETRRKHPLSTLNLSLSEAIEKEKILLKPLENRAHITIDSSQTNIHQLRDLIQQRVLDDDHSTLSILIMSFGFKHGLPLDTDFVFDVRCLPNPHWEESLRHLPGTDSLIQTFLASHEEVRLMEADITRFLQTWIPCFAKDARSYLTVAIGCTGGRHRSVYMAEKLYQTLQPQGYALQIRHRDLT